MKERPILFSAAMVRAILEGRKTQTRRVVKPQPSEDWHPDPVGWYAPTMVDKHGEEYPGKDAYGASDENEGRICPYGVPGDRLWVRETWIPVTHGSYEAWERTRKSPRSNYEACIIHRADSTIDGKGLDEYQGKWRPSIFMPRWASRIMLEITNVRVQPLQEISEVDIIAEGCPNEYLLGRNWFTPLWDSINGKTHPWASNPWLWCLTFKRVAA